MDTISNMENSAGRRDPTQELPNCDPIYLSDDSDYDAMLDPGPGSCTSKGGREPESQNGRDLMVPPNSGKDTEPSKNVTDEDDSNNNNEAVTKTIAEPHYDGNVPAAAGRAGTSPGEGSDTEDHIKTSEKAKPKKSQSKHDDPKRRLFTGEAYPVFMKEYCQELKDSNTLLPFKDRVIQCGNQWQAETPEVKQKCHEISMQQKEAYELEAASASGSVNCSAIASVVNPPKGQATKKNCMAKEGGRKDAATDSTTRMIAKTRRRTTQTTTTSSIMGIESKTATFATFNAPRFVTMIPGSGQTQINTAMSFDFDAGMEVPIYSDAFLKHNNERELELRRLEKVLREAKEQNAALQQSVKVLQNENEKKIKTGRYRKLHNQKLHHCYNKLTGDLATKFAPLPLPTTGEKPKKDTVVNYLNEAKALKESKKDEFTPFLTAMKDAISEL